MTVDEGMVESVRYADAIYERKNAQRGGTWEDGGIISIVVGMGRYQARLMELAVKRYQHGKELSDADIAELLNDFIDTINHARMGFSLLARGRWYPGDDDDQRRLTRVMGVLDGGHRDERA